MSSDSSTHCTAELFSFQHESLLQKNTLSEKYPDEITPTLVMLRSSVLDLNTVYISVQFCNIKNSNQPKVTTRNWVLL